MLVDKMMKKLFGKKKSKGGTAQLDRSYEAGIFNDPSVFTFKYTFFILYESFFWSSTETSLTFS